LGICQSKKGSLGQQELVLQAEPFLGPADRELSLCQVRRT
jgi:hypothetical protein